MHLNNVTFHIEDNYNEIIIQNSTTIHGKTELACIEGCCIHIGKDCMFSSNITVCTGDSHSIVDFSGKRLNPSKSIFINDHVWVGSKVTILKGSNIESNSIVGSGSLVSKSFKEKNIIIAGNPSKIIKKDISWIRERISL